MRLIKSFFLVVIIPLIAAGQLNDEFKKVGSTGFTFLEIPASARLASLGEAGITLHNLGAESMFINPGLLGFTDRRHTVYFSMAEWLVDTQHQSFAYALNLGNVGVVGLSVTYLDMGTMQGTRFADPENPGSYILTEKFSADAFAAGITFARRMTSQFSFGGTIKYVQESIHDYSADNMIYDVGILYFTGYRSLRVGGSVQNFGVETAFIGDNFKMPITFRLGLAMEALGTYDSPNRLTVIAENVHPSNNDVRYHFGLEYTWMDMFMLRGGYKVNYDEESFTGGLGISYTGITIDVSYTEFGRLGSVVRFSLGARL